MEENKSLVNNQNSDIQIQNNIWTEEKKELIKRTIAKGCDDDELALFIHYAKRTGLDPLAKQIYAIKRFDKLSNKYVMQIQSSIDGLRLVAERTKKYGGQIGPWWADKNGKWHDVWILNTPPFAAKVGIIRNDFKEPIYGVAKMTSYVQLNKSNQPTSLWRKMPEVMIAKCAESLGLRKAFPQELSGIYSEEEMQQTSIFHKNNESKKEVSIKQLKRMFTIVNTLGIDKDYVKKYFKSNYGIDSSKDLTLKQYNDFCSVLEKYLEQKKQQEAEQQKIEQEQNINEDDNFGYEDFGHDTFNSDDIPL